MVTRPNDDGTTSHVPFTYEGRIVTHGDLRRAVGEQVHELRVQAVMDG